MLLIFPDSHEKLSLILEVCLCVLGVDSYCTGKLSSPPDVCDAYVS